MDGFDILGGTSIIGSENIHNNERQPVPYKY